MQTLHSAAEHLPKRCLCLLDVGVLVGEQGFHVHGVDDPNMVDFKQQQVATGRFSAVHHQVLQLHAFADGVQRHLVPVHKVRKPVHEAGFFTSLVPVLIHAGVHIVNHPVRRHGHVADKGLTVDECNPDFPETPLQVAVLHELRQKEVFLPHFRQVVVKVLQLVQFAQIGARL